MPATGHVSNAGFSLPKIRTAPRWRPWATSSDKASLNRQSAGNRAPLAVPRSPLRVRYYAADGSVFFDDEYGIKSRPGRLLFLLRGRLAERFPCVQLVPVGRGRFRLDIEPPFELMQVDASYP